MMKTTSVSWVLLASVTLVAAGLWLAVSYSLASRLAQVREAYESVRPQAGDRFDVKPVDKEEYDRWISIIQSDEWNTMRVGDDVYSATYAALEDLGYTPAVKGYLELLSTSFPEAEQLDEENLRKWTKIAALRNGAAFFLRAPLKSIDRTGTSLR